jgi:hypothetical protein
MDIASQRPVNNNTEVVSFMWSTPAMMSCNERGIAGDGVFYWVCPEAL